MLVFDWLKQRASEPELMDDFSMGGAELSEALVHLRRLNRIFGATGPTKHGVERLWKMVGKPKKLSILDIGAGSGDVNRGLLHWADQEKIDLTITLVDITEEACEQARLFFRGEPRIDVKQQDLFALPEGRWDIVTSSQFVHHFASEELPLVIGCMLRSSQFGVVINDIHRHWLAWSAVWLVTHLISNNRYIRHDGPLSVAKGFCAAEWEQLKKHPNLKTLTFSWRPLFRYSVTIPKEKGDEQGA